ncbi:MAG: HD-GYP domain-containing protein [Candidatus Omnitrophota bacterium]
MAATLDFASDKHEISCRTINTIISYIKQEGKDINSFLDGLPCDEAFLTDTNNWISRELADELYRRLKMMFDDDTIVFKVAASAVKLRSLGFIDYAARLMGDPYFIIKQAPVLNKYFNRTENIEVLKYGASGATVKYYPKDGYIVNADDCYYVKGTLSILPQIFGVGAARIREYRCCVPIDKKGRMNGKFYTVDEDKYVWEHDAAGAKAGKDEAQNIGRINSDGTFKLGDTVYGAESCIYHIHWSAVRMCVKRIAYEIFQKPRVLKETIEEMQRENDLIQQKYDELYENNLKLQQFYVDTISVLIRAIDAKDHFTEDHSLNVAVIAEAIAKKLQLSAAKIETIRRACKLHDLGKIGIRESVLFKPDKLSEAEWEEIKKHPILGAEIIKPLTFLSDVAVLIREDHERWDGNGYPAKLKGDEIDIGARIIFISDAYDAMRSGRPYKMAMSKEAVIEEIKRNSGTQFDPQVVQAFLEIVPQLEK